MAYEDLPDLDALLSPAPGEAGGVGVDLRAGGEIYLVIKDLRADARLAEREATMSADDEANPLQAGYRQWSEIVERSNDVFAVSKDLEIACWLCEALVRTHGFPGLAMGLELIARLLETYWDAGLYPPEEEEGVDDRIAPLAGLLGQGGIGVLVQAIKLLPLSDRPDMPPAALWNIETISAPVAQSNSPDVREQLLASQQAQLEAINQAIKASSPDYLREVRRTVGQSLGNLDRVMNALDGRTNSGRFGSQVATPLQAIVDLLESRVGHLFVEEKAPPAGLDEVDAETGEVVAVGGRAPSGAVSSRAQALEALNAIADFFERTEPQSMVAKSLRDVVRRAQLPLEDLLAELLPDPMQRSDFLLRAGIRGEPDGGSQYG